LFRSGSGCWTTGPGRQPSLRLGISRETAGMDGADAAALWNDYRLNGNSDALRTLLIYNAEDVKNLALIRRKLGVD